MGIQTMASQGVGGGGGGQRSQLQSLARQGSLYSLTLNEVQTHLGEPLHSMNLEELLKGLDAEQSLAVDGPAGGDPYASGSTGMQRQGSLTMPRALVKKTVEEVWRDIKGRGGLERQPTLGETTLEEFLAKARVVSEGYAAAQGPPHWLYQQMPPAAAYLAVGGGSGQMSLSPPNVGDVSDSQTSGRKRGHSGDIADKMVERRQKRMIKNRESAARSRARKQAYTNELENKVSQLEEENERLEKQKELDKLLYVPPPEPKYQLRRTSSASF